MGYQVRILQSNALQIGNIVIAWDPAAGPPIVHGIHVLRDGQTIDVMKAPRSRCFAARTSWKRRCSTAR